MSKRFTDFQVNRRVNKVLQLTRGEARPKQWREINRLKGINLISLYNMVAERKGSNGFGFMGHGSWDEYLENVHGLVPLDQKQWSDERFHFTIARAMAAHPPEKVNWHGAK